MVAKQQELIRASLGIGRGSAIQWLGVVAYMLSLSILLVAILSLLWYWHWQQDRCSNSWWVLSRPVGIASMLGMGGTPVTAAELKDLQNQPFAARVTPIRAGQFQATADANLGGQKLFTALFFEAVPTEELDVIPSDFTWHEGQSELPIILGKDFLNLYNFGFAPSQGLPQMSASTIGLVRFNITISGPSGERTYLGRVVGFSDRINSVLVPLSFLNWANDVVAGAAQAPSYRLLLRVKDANDPAIARYLDKKGWVANGEQLAMSRAGGKVVAAGIALAVVAILFLLVSVSQMLGQLRFTMAARVYELSVLKQLGYEAHHLQRVVLYPQLLALGIGTIGVILGLAWTTSLLDGLWSLPMVYLLVPAAVGLVAWAGIASINLRMLKKAMQ